MDNRKAAVEIFHFYFTYDSRKEGSLRDINLTIRPGEFVVLTGPSGCGKTTLTRCINALIPNFYDGELEGKIEVCGMDIRTTDMKDISRKVGSIFQDPRSQFYTMHVISELSFAGENCGIAREEIQSGVKRAVYELKLTDLIERKIFALSTGEKQKVAVASAYVMDPEIYVLDEPSANLDSEGIEQLFEILSTLKRQGRTIIIAEHKLHYLKELADRVVCMEQGTIKTIISGTDFAAYDSAFLRIMGLRQIDLAKCVTEPRRFEPGDGPLLQVSNLSFAYPREERLWKDICFQTCAGQVVGIVGRNGAGKSTLIRVLMGLERQKAGVILYCGKPAHRKCRVKASFYVMQDVDYQLFASSVWEEMMLSDRRTKNDPVKAERILCYFQLNDLKDAHPASLSGGEKQRLAIAVACMQDKKILYFDEPTSGLDAGNMEKVSGILKQLADEGHLVFVITHDYEFAVKTFDHLIHFNGNGKAVFSLPDMLQPDMSIKINQMKES